MHVITMVLSLLYCGVVFSQSQSQSSESPLKPCRSQPQLVGKCFMVHGRLALYNGNPTMRLCRSGTKRMLGISESYSQPGYSRLPKEIAKKLNWDTELWGDYLVCPFTRAQPKHMQLICIESGKNLVSRRRASGTSTHN